MTKQDFKEFIPSLILVLTFMVAMVQIRQYHYAINAQFFFSYTVFAIVFIGFFVNRRFYRYSLGFLLIAGTMNIASFTSSMQTVGFYFKMNIGFSFNIGVQPYSLVLLIIYIAIYHQQLQVLWRKTSSKNTGNSAIEKQEEKTNAQVARFKRIFAGKSQEELQLIVNDRDRVPEAIQAAQELLDSKV